MANQKEIKEALDGLWGRYGNTLELLLDTLDKLEEKPKEIIKEVEKIVEVEADMDIDLSTPQHIAKLEQEVLGRTQQNEKA